MSGHKVESISAAISYIEAHLNEKLDLDTVANVICYSKYHLHRMFTEMVGITLHDYIQRRQLTEAAKLLVFSEKPIIQIALIAGYESQQAFTSIFKAMYKQTPLEYRQNEVFYPLQLEFTLNNNPSSLIALYKRLLMPRWMIFLTGWILSPLSLMVFPALIRAHIWSRSSNTSIDAKHLLCEMAQPLLEPPHFLVKLGALISWQYIHNIAVMELQRHFLIL